MTTITTTQKHITETAMLLKVTLHNWTARKDDKKITHDVATQHGARADRFRTRKDLIHRSALDDITANNNKIRAVWKEKTLPWLDDGVRILPSAFYFDVNAELKALIHERETIVAKFIDNYESYRDEARQALNGAFREADYPPAAIVARKFGVDVVVFPIPTGNDFRVPLGKDEIEIEIKTQVDSQVQELIANAMREPWQRIYALVEKLLDRMQSYDDTNGKVTGIFRDSTITNVKELCALLPGLNIANDVELDKMQARLLDSICDYTAEELRASPRMRDHVAKEAEKILSDISGFLA